jgi:hypothetical protein
MPARPRLTPLLLLGLLGAASPLRADPAPEAGPETLERAWSDASLYLFKESYQGFGKHDDAEARLGRAALLLVQQPKTDANIQAATAQLEALAGDPNPATLEIAATARYLLGRVAHLHRTPPDPEAAAVQYRRLLADHPGHFLADQALVKLALIELQKPALTPEERTAAIDTYASQADALARPSSRRDLHLLLARITEQYRLGDERALRHYLAADAAGVHRPTLRANVLVSIGEIASRIGREDVARTYFERFLAEFSRDYRRALVRDKLAALPPAPQSAPPPAAPAALAPAAEAR